MTKLVPPNSHKKILLHVCCAPCSGDILEQMKASGLDVTIFFFNPNIYPFEEYLRRKDEVKRFAGKLAIPFVDNDYAPDEWMTKTAGLENEPERGRRCSVCFSYRVDAAAHYAADHGFPVMATTLGISRWKDIAQVNACGRAAAGQYPTLIFWDYNWRKNGGGVRMFEVTKRENFYRQKYCGCIYSMKDMCGGMRKN